MTRPSPLSVVVLLAAAIPVVAGAQAPKRALTPADWDHWRSIAGAALSPDGRWAIYSLVPQVGDGELVVRATSGSTEYRVPRGFIGRPQVVAGARDTVGLPAGQLTADSRFAVALTYAPMAEFDRARREHRKAADQPKASLAIVRLADGGVTSVPRVKSFRVPKEAGGWVAYLLEPDSAAPSAPPAPPAPRGDSAAHGARREYGSTLVLRDLATGAEQRFADVTSYAFDDSAKWLGYTTSSRTPARDGAYVVAPAAGKEIALATGRGNYRQLAFDRAGEQVAFVSDRDEAGKDHARYALYYAALRQPSARQVVAPAAFGDSEVVSEHGRVAFTRKGNAVLFGVAPPPVDTIPTDSLYDRAVVDVWSWKDPRIQPEQRVDAPRDRARSFQSEYQVATGRVVQLANDSMPLVSVSDDGRLALAATSEPYAVERTWGEEGDDLWLIDGATGARKLIRQRIRGRAKLSPDAKYVLYFDAGHWYSYAVASGRTVDLTAPAKGVRFEEETWDTPSAPAAYGDGGFTKADRSVLLYDRYDVWEMDPSGAQPPRVLTDSLGRRQHLVFRVVNLDPEATAIDPARPVLLHAFDDSSKASGFYAARAGARREPTRLVLADVAFGAPAKAAHADQLLLTRGTFVDFPDLWTGADLARLTRISDANPQQKEFKWGSVELVNFTSADGVPLQGLLYKPEDFDPRRKYPLIAYFYERLSDNLYSYIPPFGRNVINPTHYVSNGYLIFEPDIHYEIGYPGPSAMKSIVPGVKAIVARGYVDTSAVGLQGQSWGGYQTAYLITQTHMFKAAMAGAPVANMTSAYGGIRWGPGIARAFQYEKTQSRIGGSLWQYPMRYIENSPLFWADRITTPLLMMANDADDAVPWYQGIEMFVAMRRLGKEAYLLDYNGDVHNPTKRANQKDVALKMQQFFDYHLRGYPEPDWMVHGVPYLKKGRDQLAGPAVQAGGKR